jgi:hypothetical protein
VTADVELYVVEHPTLALPIKGRGSHSLTRPVQALGVAVELLGIEVDLAQIA